MEGQCSLLSLQHTIVILQEQVRVSVRDLEEAVGKKLH
jgi:hypothetical protein